MKMQWYTWAFIAMICVTIFTLLLTKVSHLESSSLLINFYVLGFQAVGFLLLMLGAGDKFLTSKLAVILIIILSVVAIIANYAVIESYRLAPNPGYSRAIITISTAIIAIVAIITLGAKFTVVKLAGIGMIIMGILALVL